MTAPARGEAAPGRRGAPDPRPRAATLAFQGYGNVGDEAILAGVEALLAGALDVRTVFAGAGEVAAFAGAPRLRTPKSLPTLTALRALRSVDVLLMAGGGLVNDHWGAVIPRLLLWSAAARLAGTRVVWVGAGVGPIRRFPWRLAAGLMFGLAARVLVRDEASADWVRRCPLARAPEVAVDPAVFLAGPDLPPPAGAPGPLGIAGRLPVPAEAHLAPRLVDALVACATAPGTDAVLLLFDPPADAPFVAAVEAVCRARGVPVPPVIPMPADPVDGIARLAGLSGLVAVRLHGLLLGAVAGVPAVPVVYDAKVGEAARRLGLDDLAVPLDGVTAEALSEALRMAAAPERRAAVATRLAALRATGPAFRARIVDAVR